MGASEFPVGAIIANRYKVLQVVGSGGMGTVYRVEDQELEGEIVALKFLNPQLVKDKASFKRFQREVLLSRQLSHPNIVRVFDMGNADGDYFISMEFVKGQTLREKLNKTSGRKLALSESLRLLHEIAQGIAHAHQSGIVHRDLKPDNILISEFGEVKIVDFGFAEAVWKNSELTPVGETVGTPYYMAPEQIRGDPLDHRCDIYALGIIAYEIVSGRRPFEDKSWFQLAQKHLQDPIPEIVPEAHVPQWFMEIVIKCTAKDKEARYRSADELAIVLLQPNSIVAKQLETAPFQMPDFSRYNTVETSTFSFLNSAQHAIRRFNTKMFLATLGVVTVVVVLIAEIRSNRESREKLSEFQADLERKLKSGAVSPSSTETVRLFFSYINAGDAHAVTSLLESGVDPNTRSQTGDYPLHAAATARSSDVIRSLLQHGADVSLTDSLGRTPLMISIDEKDLASFEELLKYEKLINASDSSGLTPLLHALMSGKPEMVSRILAEGALVNVVDSQSTPALVYAVRSGKIENVRALVDAGASVLVTDRAGRSALLNAMDYGFDEIAEYLRSKGAS